jgi:hypothetical protein
MVRWLEILLGTLRSTVRTHRELALKNVALRQQLAVSKARQPRPRLTAAGSGNSGGRFLEILTVFGAPVFLGGGVR